jgi:hypothetical protein
MTITTRTLGFAAKCRRCIIFRQLVNTILTPSGKRGDYRVLPLLLIGFASYQLDRTNIASALTGDFAVALSVDQNTINLGNQLMFLGVIILEIPSNMILYKVSSNHPCESTKVLKTLDWSS